MTMGEHTGKRSDEHADTAAATDKVRGELRTIAEKAARDGIPVWHLHAPDRVREAIERGDVRHLNSLTARCELMVDVHMRDAAEMERGRAAGSAPPRNEDGQTADDLFKVATYFDEIRRAAEGWLRRQDCNGAAS